jgi:hypothetical protein
MPIEFSVAAYRFGHSMIRGSYALNDATEDPEPVIFGDDAATDLRGFRERPADRQIDWSFLFQLAPSDEPQLSRKINTLLAFGLAALPDAVTGGPPHPLAERNLRRGKALGLPSGQAVARAMGIPEELILCADNPTGDPARQMRFDDAGTIQQVTQGGTTRPRRVRDAALGTHLRRTFQNATPLWYYVLKEAEVLGRGRMLGPVGGRIVAEVFVGLLKGDRFSFLNMAPGWAPRAGSFGAVADRRFEVGDLLRFVTSAQAPADAMTRPMEVPQPRR